MAFLRHKGSLNFTEHLTQSAQSRDHLRQALQRLSVGVRVEPEFDGDEFERVNLHLREQSLVQDLFRTLLH